MALLSVRDVSISFAGVKALEGVHFDINAGEIVGLIGPNGAGKTTLFNCVSRLYTPSRGAIEFDGTSLLEQAAHRLASRGIARTFQNLALFPSMSVEQNILVGLHSRTRAGFAATMLALPSVGREVAHSRSIVDELITFLGLTGVRDRPATGLPFATLKRVELARALASKPRLLLMDEPAGGLNHGEVGELAKLVTRIRDERGCAILLVEHHMGLVMQISDKVVAFESGRLIASGAPAEVQAHPEVVRAYLGDQK